MRTLIRAGWVVGHEAGRHRLIHDGVVVYEGNKIVHVGKTFDGRSTRPSTQPESWSRLGLSTRTSILVIGHPIGLSLTPAGRCITASLSLRLASRKKARS